MQPVRLGVLPLAVVLFVGTVTTSTAQDAWLEIKSSHFTVVSNAGDKRARDVAWQLEQIRAAIQAGWPWARVELDRPVMVIAAKDESSMKSLVPQFWEKGNTIRPDSVFVTASDRHYIALRSDVRVPADVGINPYYASYWSYSLLAFDAAYDRPLPLWLRNGLAEVLSNSIVRDTEIQFGRPIPWLLASLQQESRLRLSELMSTDATSPYFTSGATRERFDAQSWCLMHYLLFGRPDGLTGKLNDLVKGLLEGRSSAAAMQEVYGDLGMLEQAYLRHSRQQIFQFARLKVETSVSAKSFASRSLVPPESAATRAGFHVAMGRPAEARALIDEARKGTPSGPGSHEVEAMLLDRDGKRDEAQAALAKAAELNSENFYAYYRLATLMWRPNPDATMLADVEKWLRRAVALNGAYAPSLSMLADVLALGNQPASAIEFATKAVSLEPGSVSPRLSLARVLWVLARRDDAKSHAKAALSLARTDQERKQVQDLIDFFDKAPPQK